ncbi:transporter substrate-binding domain-containing protein [Fictibacillus sp. WQ 8-8]|uniref:Transporter substrate-binding domain-containing protein n=1 Tax=Fictibacillus marinisediminis TaxID=2878389 RepID=A0A9X2BE88_9BACL|nr:MULTISPECIES: transporter substrate-binding domain-containing protein [Fictibacillus]MCK6255852.1 transporter substrate-binding domain-containing protein [Fictibacillus marinisediminis]MCQ6267058.1 transporter substrate-binding domain-containing protein [Fictibacillus sp. WQ 8-8]MED2972167.1 transporter substrate-binding domain-containing protein [Fictibacillus sp. B-59209]
MKKLWALLMVSVMLAGVLTACGNNGEKKKELTIGTEATYPPFSYRDKKTNEVTGYDVEVAKEVAKRLDMKPKVVPTEWKNMFSSLGKRFDMVANQVTITPERKKQFAFSSPYTVSGGKVIVNKNNKDIKSIKDLKGKVVGTTQGSNYAAQAEKAGAKVKYYKGIAQVLTDLDVNRVDAALNDELFILTELKNTKYNVKPVGEPFSENKMAFAFKKNDKDLAKKVDKALADMKKDGTLSKLSKKYFGADVSE